MSNKTDQYLFALTYTVIGVFIAYALLQMNQTYPIQLNIASMLSPTGGSLYIKGFHFKHWILGVVLMPIGFFTSLKSKYGYVLLGAGFMLMIDEVDDIVMFMQTGTF